MNSKEIREVDRFTMSDGAWLREIAYQLALLNEKNAPEPELEMVETVKRGPGRPRKVS